FVPHPVHGPACKQLVERIVRGEIFALVSTHVLSDVAHRVMTMEAMARYGWPAKGIAQRLRQHPAEVQALVHFRQAVEEVPNLGIQVLPTAAQQVLAAAAL